MLGPYHPTLSYSEPAPPPTSNSHSELEGQGALIPKRQLGLPSLLHPSLATEMPHVPRIHAPWSPVTRPLLPHHLLHLVLSHSSGTINSSPIQQELRYPSAPLQSGKPSQPKESEHTSSNLRKQTQPGNPLGKWGQAAESRCPRSSRAGLSWAPTTQG